MNAWRFLIRALGRLMVCCGAIAATCVPTLAAGQVAGAPPGRPPQMSQDSGHRDASVRFDPGTGRVTITVLPPDAASRGPALRPENFVVYEDGARQNHINVEVKHVPLSLGLLLEFGGRYPSMNAALAADLADAVKQLLDELGEQDQVACWKYGDQLETVADLSHPGNTLRRVFANPTPPPVSEVNFYDALIAALPEVQQWSGRKALILAATGVDTFSNAHFPDVLRAVRQAGVPIYVINLGRLVRSAVDPFNSEALPYAHLQWQKAQSQLERIARASGGRVYSPEFRGDFTGQYDGLIADLRLQYIIRYSTNLRANLKSPRLVQVAVVNAPASARPSRGGNEKPAHNAFIAEGSYVVSQQPGS